MKHSTLIALGGLALTLGSGACGSSSSGAGPGSGGASSSTGTGTAGQGGSSTTTTTTTTTTTGSGGQGGEGGATTATTGATTGGGGQGGAPIVCQSPADCPGNDGPCASRTCVGGACGLSLVAAGVVLAEQMAGDCAQIVCDGQGSTTLVVDGADVLVDGDLCTDDLCTAGMPTNPPAAAGTPCAAGGTVCDGQGSCVACLVNADCAGGKVCVAHDCIVTSCSDQLKNGGESDVDCGGPCAPCAAGQGCLLGADCQTGVCDGAVCLSPTCSDGVKNGGETDVDCGNDCAPCGAGQGCQSSPDCVAPLACGPAGTCLCPDPLGCQLNHLWSKRFGGLDDDDGNAMVVRASSLYLGGSFVTSVNFGGGALSSQGNDDIYVARLDLDGNHLWSKRFGDAAFQYVTAIAADPADNVIVGGLNNGTVNFGGGALTTSSGFDACVAKLSPAGAHVWSKSYSGNGNQAVRALATDAAGNVYLGASVQGSINLGAGSLVSAGSNDIVLAKLSPNGALLWGKIYGDASAQSVAAMVVDGAGNLITVGAILGSIDFGAGVVTSAGGSDIYVAKYDPNGNLLWAKLFGDVNGGQLGRAVAVDAANDIYVAGSFGGTADFGGGPLVSAGLADAFVAKLSPNGAHLWSKRYGDAQDQAVLSVAFDAAGNVLLTGSFAGSIDFGTGALPSAGNADIFVAKLSAAGAAVQARRYGDGSAVPQVGRAVAGDGSGAVYAFGDFGGTVSFGGAPLTSAGSLDLFLVKLTP